VSNARIRGATLGKVSELKDVNSINSSTRFSGHTVLKLGRTPAHPRIVRLVSAGQRSKEIACSVIGTFATTQPSGAESVSTIIDQPSSQDHNYLRPCFRR
jgi:hypothetical protein